MQLKFKRAGAVIALGAVIAAGAITASAATASGTNGYTPVTQTRVYDSRTAGHVLAAGATQVITIPTNLVPAGASAINVQLTTASETAVNGDLEVHPDGIGFAPGKTSNLNFTRNTAITSETTVTVGSNGKFDVTNHSTGSLRLVVDVLGYYAPVPTYTPPVSTTETGTATLPAVGGSWGAGHSAVTSFTLAAGTYEVNLTGDFYKVATTTATPVLQIQLNGADKQLTGYTGAFPYDASEAVGATGGEPNGLEQTAVASGIITLTKSTTLEIDAFGYNPNRSGDGGGDFAVNASLSAVPVGATASN